MPGGEVGEDEEEEEEEEEAHTILGAPDVHADDRWFLLY